MKTIDTLLKDSNHSEALEQSTGSFKLLLSKILNLDEKKVTTALPSVVNKTIKILLTCNWCSNKELCDTWNKMSKDGNYTWNNIQIVWERPYDYVCIINQPNNLDMTLNPDKTILFRMEPHMDKNVKLWDPKWLNPDRTFLFSGFHDIHFNNIEWHVSKSYQELSSGEEIKKTKLLSSVLSDKYKDPGHIKRIDFMKFIEKKGDVVVDIFGSNKFLWKNYKGHLPYHEKDNALLPYKYTFNCENHSIKNYVTEKLIDGILSECLVFYSGCYNVRDLIDDRAYVYLELSNFESDYQLVKKAIEEDLWSQRIKYIREAKEKILNELQFFPMLEKIVKG